MTMPQIYRSVILRRYYSRLEIIANQAASDSVCVNTNACFSGTVLVTSFFELRCALENVILHSSKLESIFTIRFRHILSYADNTHLIPITLLSFEEICLDLSSEVKFSCKFPRSRISVEVALTVRYVILVMYTRAPRISVNIAMFNLRACRS